MVPNREGGEQTPGSKEPVITLVRAVPVVSWDRGQGRKGGGREQVFSSSEKFYFEENREMECKNICFLAGRFFL